MPSNCSLSNCVGNSCLTKRRNRRTKKSRSRRSRLRGGAPPTIFTVVLFSAEPVDDETKDNVKNLLTGLYGAIEMTEGKLDEYVFDDFKNSTGLRFNEEVEDESNSISYRVKVAPAILTNKNLKTDKRLTILEGQIGSALLKSELNVSLIEVTHGLRPNVNSQVNAMPNMYYIGLCTPKCTEYDQETFNSYVSQEDEGEDDQ